MRKKFNLNMSYDEVYNYYIKENHSCQECAIYFNCSVASFKHYSHKLGIYKDSKTAFEISSKTKLERYGNANFCNSEKRKKTNLKRYGTEELFSKKEIKEKIKQTRLKKYGCEEIGSSETIKLKRKHTLQQKWGVSSIGQLACIPEIRQKINATIQTKYNVENISQSKQIKEKKIASIKKRYGVDHFAQTDLYHEKCRKKYLYNSLYFDSKPELALYIYAQDHQEDIIRQPIALEYLFKGKTHLYYPDFKYKGSLVELKGDQFFKKGKLVNPWDSSLNELYEAKHQCGLKNGVFFWTSKDYNFALDYMKKTYGNQWDQQYKL